MTLVAGEWKIEIMAEEFGYDPKPTANPRAYERVYEVGENPPSSFHAVRVYEGEDQLASAILVADGGASGVHEATAIADEASVMVAVGAYAVRLSLPALNLLFVTRVDAVTCFGLHSIPGSTDVLSHGELEIARLSNDGRILWSRSGRDIFSGDVAVLAQSVRAVDFEENVYRFDLSTGRSLDAC